MSAFSTTASVVISEFALREINVEIVFDILNRDVLMDLLRVVVRSSSAAHLVFLLALETEEVSITSAAVVPLIILLVLVLRNRIRLLLTNIKHVSLRLKVFNAEIRSQNVLGQLLLELLFDFLSESLVHKSVIWIKFCQDYHFEASNDPLFLEFDFFGNLHHFVVFHNQVIEIA